MSTAYDATPILERLPLQIEALTAYDDNLVVGTRQGHLLMYAVTETSQGRWDVSLLCSNKNFSRKPIMQVQVVPEHQIIVSLSDNMISVHDLTVFNLPLLLSMPQTKGATAFDLDIRHHVSLTGETVATVRLAVAVKRRLQLYYWKARKFHNLREDLQFSDVPRALTWCKEAIAVAFKNDYWLVQLTGEQKELFGTGKSQEPLILRLEEEGGMLVLVHEKETVIMDSAGNAKCEHTLKWGDQPVAMAYDKPFLISILPKSVEVKTPEPNIDVQTMSLDKPKLIAVANTKKGVNPVYIASTSHIWRLRRTQTVSHVNELVKQEKFSLALKLLEVLEDPKEVKEQMVLHVKHMQAFYFFQHMQFKESMNLFLEVNRDSELAFVIGLFPKMVPEEFRFQINLPGRVPNLTSSEMENAIQELIHFLVGMKRRYIDRGIEIDESSDCNITHLSSGSSGKAATSLKEKIQVIDTTLLRCYIEANNNTLVESLVRISETRISLPEGERILKRNEKYYELVLFYRSRGHHKRALQLLQRHSDSPESPLYGYNHTISYLQNLGPEHIDLIDKYSAWVMKSHPKEALRIFIGDKMCSGEVELLPRQRVISILRRRDQQLVMEYLEHVVWEWEDTNPIIHNELIMQYHRIILKPYESSDPVNMEKEKSQKEEVRNKLLMFLNESKYYTSASLLAHFNSDLLHRERTVLLGRLGQHQQALTIFTLMLGEVDKALEYCHKHYVPYGNGSEVYLILLKLIVTSKDSPTNSPNKLQTQKVVETALEILQNYLHCIDLSQALKILPDEVKMQVLQPFIRTSLNHSGTICRKKQVTRGLTQSLKLQTSKDMVSCQSRKMMLSDMTQCAVCRRRFTKHTAFAWYPSGEVVHFSCQDQR